VLGDMPIEGTRRSVLMPQLHGPLADRMICFVPSGRRGDKDKGARDPAIPDARIEWHLGVTGWRLDSDEARMNAHRGESRS
jgi:hypothetical protein